MEAHEALASSLLASPSSSNIESSTSLQHTLLSLRNASSARGEAHQALAYDLARAILLGFTAWKERHAVRLKGAQEEMLSKEGVIRSYEKDVLKLVTVGTSWVMGLAG